VDLPSPWKSTLQIRALGLAKIPLLFFVRPRVVELSVARTIVKIPLLRRTKNHLGSMYFGALSIGADITGGILAWRLIENERKRSGTRIALVFKSFQAEFLKRPEGDVHFECVDGPAIQALVERTLQSNERQELPVHIVASVPSLGPEPVARFTLLLSLKKK
jgi:hypothetical protein